MDGDGDPGGAGPASGALQARAERVIAGAAGRRSMPFAHHFAGFPWWVDRAEGATVTDVDGRCFIDLTGSYGPNLLGHRHPAVEEAATRQRERGDSMGAQTETAVELAELLCDRLDPVDWVFFGKNGSDATTHALRVARVATGHSRVLVAEASYHTAHDWGSIYEAGIPEAHRSLRSTFTYDDADSLRGAVDAVGGDVAAIVLTPFHQGYFRDPVLPSDSFVRAVRAEADRCGALVVLDDVRAGMRMHPSGGSSAAIGLDADLVCFGKAVANGRALSICAGRAEVREAADRVGYLGTFFASAVAPAASLATFRAFDAEGAFDRMMAVGDRLAVGLRSAAAEAGLDATLEGVPTMALVRIDGDDGFRRLNHVWAAAMVERGVLVHPTQAWYLCAALTDEQVAAVLERAADSFAVVARSLDAGS